MQRWRSQIELLKLLADDQFDIGETCAAHEAALSRVWDDPRLDECMDRDGTPVD